MTKSLNKHFGISLIILCLGYLLFQIWYLPQQMLGPDEFWFAKHIYQYTKNIPYQDFLPYKTTLGYYLLTPSFWLSQDAFNTLIYTKLEIAMINTCMLAISAGWLRRYFQPSAVLITLALVLASQLFMLYSTELRVDMLSAWVAFMASMLLLSQRMLLAGIAIAVAFLISQKAVWYIMAANIGLCIEWWCYTRHTDFFKKILYFNLAILLCLSIYLSFWSLFANPTLILINMFYESYLQAKIIWYHKIYYSAWQEILANGPILFLLWPLCWVTLLNKSKQRIFILTYSSVALVFLISYQQPFPYNMVLAAPVFLLLYSDFLTWFFQTLAQPLASSRLLFWFYSSITLAIISIALMFGLPIAYYLLIPLPGLIYWLTTSNKFKVSILMLTTLAVIFIGLIYPVLRLGVITYLVNGSYQKETILLAQQLLQKNEGYFAGMPLLYYQEQAIPGLKNLIGPAIDYLYQAKPSLKPMLLASLDMEPTSPEKIIQAIQSKPLKLYIDNGRVESLPPVIKHYLNTEYQHFWGSIFLYAPTFSAQQTLISLKFSGSYQLESLQPISIDQKSWQPTMLLTLQKGQHFIKANTTYRLKYVPEHLLFKLNLFHQDNDWYTVFKPVLL